MRKKYLAVAAISFCSMFMYGCVASEGDMDFLYSRQREIETTLKKTQKDIDWLKAEVKKEENILDLNEKTFELENKLLELEQIIGEMHTQNEERFKTIEGRLSMRESSVSQDSVPKPETQPATDPPKTQESSTGEPEMKSPPVEKDPKENYDLGRKEFADGNYEAAERC